MFARPQTPDPTGAPVVDSRQAVERARAWLDSQGDTVTISGRAMQIAEDVLALAAALADTERERDEARAANTALLAHPNRAAEARVAEPEAALTETRGQLVKRANFAEGWHSLRNLAASLEPIVERISAALAAADPKKPPA